MIARHNRGLSRDCIIDIIKSGKRIPIAGGVVFLKHKSAQALTRLAVIVPKKTNQTAVMRNKIRRTIQTAFLANTQDNNSPSDIVVLWKDSAIPSERTLQNALKQRHTMK